VEQRNDQFATLVDLLDGWGIDMRAGTETPVRVLRHAGDRGAVQRLYAIGIEAFECYQRVQKTRIFGDAKILVSFIKTDGLEAAFAGAYRVIGVEPCPADFALPVYIPEDLRDKCRSNWLYSLERCTEFDRLRERIRILWDKVENCWMRVYPDANRPVVAIRDEKGNWIRPRRYDILSSLTPDHGAESSSQLTSEFYAEGSRILRTHLVIERNRKLVEDSKREFQRQHGRLFCEVCEFDFAKEYGEEYIECHHTIPVHSMPSDGKTDPKDVAMLCANCHRMIHRRREWMSTEGLRSLWAERRNPVG
jgi:hypothetical protein